LNTDSELLSLSLELCDIIFHSHHFSVLIYFRTSKRFSFLYFKTLSHDVSISQAKSQLFTTRELKNLSCFAECS
jgi:hypothetical protein